MFEWAYSWTDRHRTYHKERDEKFHSYRRLDAGKWGRFNMYPGAMLVMPTRLLLSILALIIMAILATLIACCRDFKKYGPLKKGPRKTAIEIIFKLFGNIILIIFGCWTTVKEVDVNYTYYLGPDYK